MTKVKVCGTTNLADAEHGAELGVWAVGMVFHRPSPRRCTVPEAEEIGAFLKGTRTRAVGVFVDETLDRLVRIASRAHLDIVQLHGDEGASYATEVQRRTGAKVMKAVRVRDRGDVQELDAYRLADFHLVDAHVEGLRGGTGTRLEPRLLTGRLSDVPLVLSGGLNPENVAEAILAVRPWGVDAASGLEAEPGRKDAAKVEAFVAAVAAIDETLEPEPEPEPEPENEPEVVA